jgi:hypothetical protein
MEDLGSVDFLGAFTGCFDDLEVYFILIHMSVTADHSCLVELTCPMSAMVKPAKAPPSSTKKAATLKYSHKLGSSASFGSGSSCA